MPILSIHGDVHIPDNIIHALGLKPGTELAFERQSDAIIMRPVKTNKSSQVDEGPKILDYRGLRLRRKRWTLPLPKARCMLVPIKKVSLVKAWIILHEDELMADWSLAVNGEPVFQIKPLQ